MTDTTTTDAWETLSASDALSPAEFFEQHELQAFTEQLIEVTGADTVKDLAKAIVQGGAAAAAAGSMFVFHGELDGVLINMPGESTLVQAFAEARTD